MQRIVFTGYNGIEVESSLKKIMRESRKCDVSIHGLPEHHDECLPTQPVLHGSGYGDMTIMSLIVSGSLKNIKRLLSTPTPEGMMLELLPIDN